METAWSKDQAAEMGLGIISLEMYLIKNEGSAAPEH